MRHEKMDKEFTIHYDNRRKGKRQENGVAIWLWILILSLMLLISLTTSPLTIEEDATIFDDGTLPLAEIYLSPGITVGYVIVSAQSGATKRDIYIGSESLFTGCGVYIGTDMVSQMSINIDGHDTKATLALLALATEGAKIRVDGVGRVALGSQDIILRVDQNNILLGQSVSVQGKPILEVATDRIEGGHSCRVHRISGEALFYLQSHGIDAKDAECMLLDAEISRHLEPLDNEKKSEVYIQIQKQLGFLK